MKTEQELIKKLDKLVEEKKAAIKNQDYEKAAYIRDKIRTNTNLLEEMMNPPIFCNENELSEKIKEKIIPLFLNLNNKEIKNIYNYYKSEYPKVEMDFDEKVVFQNSDSINDGYFKDNKKENLNFLGCDIPTWFNLQKSENIMFVGLDPLRSVHNNIYDEYNKDTEKVELGTPYAFHIKDLREKLSKTGKYFNFIQELAKDNGVYITDASKVFYREKITYEKRSTHNKAFWKQKIHFEILKKEIEVIQPKLIITLGTTTAYMLSGNPITFTEKVKEITTYNEGYKGTIALGETPLLCLSHLSNANNGGINTFLKTNNKPSGNAETQVNSYVELVKEKLAKEGGQLNNSNSFLGS